MVGLLTIAGFLIFAQAFMIAPILPRLATALGVGTGVVGLAVPAYLIPYGAVSLAWGPTADRAGRRPVILGCLAAFAAVTAATAAAGGVGWFIAARLAAGVVAGGVVPVGVALVGDVVPYALRGRALGWLFGGMAGGMAIGSTAGALAEPLIGWRGLFVTVAVATAVIVLAALRLLPDPRRASSPGPSSPPSRPSPPPSPPRSLPSPPPPPRVRPRAIAAGYLGLLRNPRARRTYAYVGFNAVVQSGIYTWLGVLLHQRYSLGPVGIGLALLGYGLPGFVLGPAIGRAADRFGRALLIPAGVGLGGAAAYALAAPIPLIAAAITITVLSLGYDLTQPLLAGIVTDLPGRRGQAVALMAVILFGGFGAGSLLFQAALIAGFGVALVIFGGAATIAAALAVPAFRRERAGSTRHSAGTASA